MSNCRRLSVVNLGAQLQQADVFGKLSSADHAELERLATRRRFDSGEFICRQGDVWPSLAFLSSGQARWFLTSTNGQEYVLSILGPGSTFLGHSLFDDEPMPASLTATELTDIYVWGRSAILPMLYRNPEAMWDIPRLQVRTMRRAREIIYGLAFQPVAGRLARLLLEQFLVPEQSAVERDLTLTEISSMVASSPEVICRLLHQFQEDGILRITRAQIVMQDRPALQRLADQG
jgi:CRP-like cAMP-binding protein